VLYNQTGSQSDEESSPPTAFGRIVKSLSKTISPLTNISTPSGLIPIDNFVAMPTSEGAI